MNKRDAFSFYLKGKNQNFAGSFNKKLYIPVTGYFCYERKDAILMLLSP